MIPRRQSAAGSRTTASPCLPPSPLSLYFYADVMALPFSLSLLSLFSSADVTAPNPSTETPSFLRCPEKRKAEEQQPRPPQQQPQLQQRIVPPPLSEWWTCSSRVVAGPRALDDDDVMGQGPNEMSSSMSTGAIHALKPTAAETSTKCHHQVRSPPASPPPPPPPLPLPPPPACHHHHYQVSSSGWSLN